MVSASPFTTNWPVFFRFMAANLSFTQLDTWAKEGAHKKLDSTKKNRQNVHERTERNSAARV